MANTPQARKRARQNDKRRDTNMHFRSVLRTVIKKTLSAIQSGDKKTAKAAFKQASPTIDHMANKGIIHKNTAARYKSRLNAKLRSLS